MKPNWIVLAYVVAFAAALAAVVALASLAAVLHLAGVLAGRPSSILDGWLLVVSVVALGIMPWPALVALARALLLPARPNDLRVESTNVGEAVVALTALNEEEAIGRAVRGFASEPRVGSVVVVDNASTDRTRALAQAAGAQVVEERRRGYGHACIRALREGLRSGYPVVILCEADGTFRPEDVEKLTAYIKHADLVVGSRTHRALLNSDSQLNSFFIIGNVLMAKLLQLRYWDWRMGGIVRLTDTGCTYRAIRAEALERILPSLEVGGHYFGPHMVMVALEHGLRVIEIPVTFCKRIGSSKGGNASWRMGFAVGLSMLWHILSYRVRRGPAVAFRHRPDSVAPQAAAARRPTYARGLRARAGVNERD